MRVPAQLPDDLLTRCTAAALVLPERAAFSHGTAVELLGLWLPHRWRDRPLHASVPPGVVVPVKAGITAHQASWSSGDVGSVSGLRVTSGARTLCDLAAAGWPLVDLVVLADSLLRLARADRTELVGRVTAWSGTYGAPRLREVLTLMHERVDSAMETRLRLILHDAGLPEPVVNLTVVDTGGGYLHRPDLSWPEWKVAADYDGAHHLVDVERRRRIDISRKEALEEAGWTLRVFTATDVLHSPDRTAERVRRALRERGARLREPARPGPRW